MKHLPFILLLAAGCAGGPIPSEFRPVEAGRAPRLSAPVATEGFRLVWEGDEAPGIEDLLREYARVTGQTVLMTAETRQVVRKSQLDKAGGEDVLEVAAEDVQEVTEALLVMHQFALIPTHDAELRMVQVISLETQERNFIRRSATYVPLEELDAWRGRAATLITTSLLLPNVDIRVLSNSMRAMLTDANIQQIIPAGNSNTLILTGFGSDICDLVDLLRRIDAEAEPVAEPVPGAGQPR